MNTAILWLTHFFDPEAEEAFSRLCREASGHGDVIQVQHGSMPSLSRALHRDRVLSISDDEIRAALPRRTQQAWMLGRGLEGGYLDTLHMAIMRRVHPYDQVWIIEYDVDFSGHWSTFFTEFASLDADLLGTTLYPRHLSQAWHHWLWFGGPASPVAYPALRGFFPILRMSRRFAEVYAAQVSEAWIGNYEALYPTIAVNCGLAVQDLGGTGPFVPPRRRGRLYSNSDDPALRTGTFRYRPAVSDRYFPHGLTGSHKDHLWHPIKTKRYAALSEGPSQATERAGAT